MDRFTRFRRYKKATAAAAAASAGAPLTGTAGPTVPSGTISSAGTPIPPQQTPFSAPTPPPRPATSGGTPHTSVPAPPSIPPPAIPRVPSIHANSGDVRPMTSSSHAPSMSFFSNSAPPVPPLPAAPIDGPLQTPTPAAPTLAIPAPTQQKTSGATGMPRSPFRNFLRSSTKRSRASPPTTPTTAAMPASPTAGLHVQMQSIAFSANGTSPSPPKRAGGASIRTFSSAQPDERRSILSATSSQRLMPSFLNATPQEMEQKFNDLVWLERSRISHSVTQPRGRWARVQSAHARALDRYLNIQPWEHNRIKLQVPTGHMEYINASPIVLTTTATAAHGAAQERPPDRFIAMQGPKQNSVNHVWRMVYEQLRSPAVIVMLTETHEGMQEKCYPYFPRHPGDAPMQINEHDEFGDGFRATVRCDAIEETAYGDAIELRRIVMRVHGKTSSPAAAKAAHDAADGGARLFPSALRSEDVDTEMGGALLRPASASTSASTGASIGGVKLGDADETDKTDKDMHEDSSMADGDDERVVYHFLYKRWPDFGVPVLDDVDSFLGLMRLSAEKNADHDNPRVVHCSAGVGRSGTFIALEHLQRELDAGVLEGEVSASASADEGSPYASDLVFATVNQLREQRRMMVQAESQYMFIYRVLRKLWEDKYGVQAPAPTQTVDDGSDTSSHVSEPAAKRLEVDRAY